jgi:hypothetical protein
LGGWKALIGSSISDLHHRWTASLNLFQSVSGPPDLSLITPSRFHEHGKKHYPVCRRDPIDDPNGSTVEVKPKFPKLGVYPSHLRPAQSRAVSRQQVDIEGGSGEMSDRQATQPFRELDVELDHPPLPAFDVLIMTEIPKAGPTFDPGTDPLLIHDRQGRKPLRHRGRVIHS